MAHAGSGHDPGFLEADAPRVQHAGRHRDDEQGSLPRVSAEGATSHGLRSQGPEGPAAAGRLAGLGRRSRLPGFVKLTKTIDNTGH